MATRKPTARRRDLACVRIGYEEFLLDADKAMQVVKLFRESLHCRKHFSGTRYQYVAGGTPELELTLVAPDQVVVPSDVPALEGR